MTLNSLTTSKTITSTKTISQFSILSINVNLGTSANIIAGLYDASGNILQTTGFVMSGTDYANWGNSDIPYVENWVAAQIENLTSL